jgi:GNAT superfamily N-acetyltransferase
MGDLELRSHAAGDVPGMRDELLDAHLDANADLLGDPFFSRDRFGERLDRYAQDPTFALVTGRLDGQLRGYAFGSTLTADTGWWRGLSEATEPDLARETGSRTFAFREFLVRQAYRRRGYGRQLHNALLRDRPEERATLLVRQDNPAKWLYLRWTWRLVGKLQPYDDSPVFDSMVLDLPAG